MPVVGFLNAQTPHEFTHLVVAFHRGLNEGGFVEGQNVAIEYRWAEQHYDRLPGLAADLVGLDPAAVADQWKPGTPNVRPAGIDTVVLNGRVVVERGVFDRSAHAGTVLR